MTARFIAMKMGEKSGRVAKARKLLAKAGSTLKEGDTFDIGMLSAVKAFQKRTGLKVTGMIDAATMNALSAFDKPVKKTASKKPAGCRK